MADKGSMADNVSKGRGIISGKRGKDGFVIVGANESDRQSSNSNDINRGRGRPVKDQNFNQVGPDAEGEQGSSLEN